MAVIKNNKTGMWEVRTYYKDLTGARKQKTKRGFAKKSEALEWERNFKLKEEQSISMSFKSFVDIYLADLEPRIKRNTFLTKKHIIETKILPYFGKRKLDDIRTSDVIQWQNEVMKLKKDNGELFSPTYLKTIHNQLSAILNHAVNMYGLKDNVARKAGTMGKEENKEMEFWTQEEFQAFLECVADKPISYYAFEILYWTGIREGELLALQVKDIDFEQGTITVDESLTRLDGEDLITAPKTESSVRVITIHKELQEELKEYIATLYHVRPGTRLFAGRTKEMKRGIKMSGVKKITVHCTRHSHASRSEIDEMKDRDILGFSMVENKDSFLLAVAMGVDSPEAVKSKDGWFLMKNLKTTDKALLVAVLLGTANDDSDVDAFADIEKALDLCEQCAESGFKDLRKRIIDAGKDREILERRMMKELDLLYTTNVEADI